MAGAGSPVVAANHDLPVAVRPPQPSQSQPDNNLTTLVDQVIAEIARLVEVARMVKKEQS
jgi:hypothetical protein